MDSFIEKKKHLYRDAVMKKSIANHVDKEFTNEYMQLSKLLICNVTKNFSNICDILSGTDRFLIDTAVRYKWYFHLDTEYHVSLIENVLVNASRYSRFKILEAINKNSKEDKVCDILYKIVMQKFGEEYSTRLLPSCTKELIEVEMNKGKVTDLRYSQMVNIFKKCPSAIMLYLEQFAVRNHSKIIFNKMAYYEKFEMDLYITRMASVLKFFKTIISSHTNFVLSYYKKYYELFPINHDYNSCYCLTFGRKQTKAVLTNAKHYIIENSRIFIKTLRRATLCRLLSPDEFNIFFYNLLPDDPNLIDFHDMYKVACHIKGKERFKMLRSNYTQKYKRNIVDDDRFSTSPWPSCMDKDERHTWALAKLSDSKAENASQLDWYKFCCPSYGMTKIEEEFDALSNKHHRLHCINATIDLYIMNEESDEIFDFMIHLIMKLERHPSSDYGLDDLHQKVRVFNLAPAKWLKLQPIFKVLGIYDNTTPSEWCCNSILQDFLYRKEAFDEQLPGYILKNFIPITTKVGFINFQFDFPVKQELYISIAKKRFSMLINETQATNSKTNDDIKNITACLLSMINDYNFNKILHNNILSMINESKIYLTTYFHLITNSYTDAYMFCGPLRLLLVDHLLDSWNHQKSYMVTLKNKPKLLNNERLMKCLDAQKTKRPQMRTFYDSLRCFYKNLHTNLLSELEMSFMTSDEENTLEKCAYAITRLLPGDLFESWFLKISKSGVNVRVILILKNLHHVRPVLNIDFLLSAMRTYTNYIPIGVLLSIYNQLSSSYSAVFMSEVNRLFNFPKEFLYYKEIDSKTQLHH